MRRFALGSPSPMSINARHCNPLHPNRSRSAYGPNDRRYKLRDAADGYRDVRELPVLSKNAPMDTKGRLGKGKKEARREVESRKRAAITILTLRRLSFARQDQRDHLGDVGVSCITFTLPLLSPESQLLFFCASLLWRWSLDDHPHAAAFRCGPQRVRSHPPPGRTSDWGRRKA